MVHWDYGYPAKPAGRRLWEFNKGHVKQRGPITFNWGVHDRRRLTGKTGFYPARETLRHRLTSFSRTD
jgi:hypothetical protein